MNAIESFDSAKILGTTLGSATLLEELARGAMGVVYIAFQRSLKRRIAVKVLPRCLYTEESVRLFEQEAEAAAGLSHPNIVPIYEIGEAPGFRWFSMQLIEGGSLAAKLRRVAAHPVPSRRTLPLRSAFAIVRQVLEALDHAHRRRVVHRDIKPENILLIRDSDTPVITDFGISRIASAGADAMQIPRGSPLYMAPEQVLRLDIDARADIYAAGILLFRLLVEALPLIPHRSAEELIKVKLAGRRLFTRRPSEANPRLNGEADDLIAGATAFDPAGRYGSCREFLAALEGYARRHLELPWPC